MQQPSPEVLNQFKKWCNKAERCRSEFVTRAKRLGLSVEEYETLLMHLVNEGSIDELRYAKAFVHDKSAIARWPEKRIQQTLKIKGIPMELIRQAMEEEYALDEYAEMKRRIELKLRTCRHNDPKKRYAAVFRHLTGKGFSVEKVSQMMRNYSEWADSI